MVKKINNRIQNEITSTEFAPAPSYTHDRTEGDNNAERNFKKESGRWTEHVTNYAPFEYDIKKTPEPAPGVDENDTPVTSLNDALGRAADNEQTQQAATDTAHLIHVGGVSISEVIEVHRTDPRFADLRKDFTQRR